MRRIVSALVLACLIACEDETLDPDDKTRNQLGLLDIQLRQLEMRTMQYTESMEIASQSSCIAIHRTYNVDVRMQVFRMTQVETDLDAAITANGDPAYADIACSIDALTAELDYHEAVACQDATIELNRAEATRHLDAIAVLRMHLEARSAEIAAGLDAGSATWTFATPPRACP